MTKAPAGNRGLRGDGGSGGGGSLRGGALPTGVFTVPFALAFKAGATTVDRDQQVVTLVRMTARALHLRAVSNARIVLRHPRLGTRGTADPTLAATNAVGVRVLGRELMAIDALSLGGVQRGRTPAASAFSSLVTGSR